MELFAEFFQMQNGYEMSEEQDRLIREIWGEETGDAAEYGMLPEKGGDGV
jgi:hypothetical protein